MGNKQFCLILVLIILFNVLNHLIWIKDDFCLSHPDAAYHLSNQMKFYKVLRTNENKLPSVFSKLKISENSYRKKDLELENPFWPRLVYIVTAYIQLIFGKSYRVLLMSNLLYLIILIGSVVFLGKKIFNSQAGLLAGFIVSCYPGILGISRQFSLDLPLIAVVALSICLLVYSNYMRRLRYIILFAIFFIIGMNVKLDYIIFLSVPLALVICKSVQKNKIYVFYLLGALFVIFVIGIILNLDKTREVIEIVFHKFIFPFWRFKREYITISRVIKLYWFWWLEIVYSIFYPFILFLVIGTWKFVRSREIKNKGLTIVWILSPYILLSLIIGLLGWIEARRLFPSIPAFAIVTACGILGFKNRKLRYGLVSSIVVLGLTQFYLLSFTDILHKRYSLSSRSAVFEYTRSSNTIDRLELDLLKRRLKEMGFTDRDSITIAYDSRFQDSNFILSYYDYLIRLAFPLSLVQQYSLKDLEDASKRSTFLFFVNSFYQDNCHFKSFEIVPWKKGKFAIQLYTELQEEHTIRKGSMETFVFDRVVNIYKNKKTLIGNRGLESSFVYNNRRYVSAQGYWNTKKIAPNKMEVAITYPDIDVLERWEVEVNADRVNWQVRFESDKDLEIRHAHVRFQPALHKYNRYFTLWGEESIEMIKIPVKGKRGEGGLVGFGSMKSDIPVAIVNYRNSPSYRNGILSFDLVNDERRYGLHIGGKEEVFTINRGENLVFSGSIEAISLGSVKDYIERVRLRDSIEQGLPKVVFLEGGLRIYKEAVLITEGNGIESSFEFNNKIYGSSTGNWRKKKVAANKMEVEITYPDIDVVERWEFEVNEDKINWQMLLGGDDLKKVTNLYYNLHLDSNIFDSWYSFMSTGTFNNRVQEWRGAIQKNPQCKYIGLATSVRNRGKYKSLILNLKDNIYSVHDVVVYKQGERKIEFYPESFKQVDSNGLVASIELYNQQHIFENRLELLEKKEQNNRNLKRENQIQKGHIKVFFDNGQGRIYWKDKEITHLFGMYTSVQSKGLWRDSQQAFWRVEKLSENRIRAYGEWIHLPIEQIWDIELDNNTIYWKVVMEVRKPVVIDKEEANIMVSENYRKWSISRRKTGRFPDKLHSSLWKALYRGSSHNVVKIRADRIEDSYPDILFKIQGLSGMDKLQVRNTNRDFGGRVVGSYLENKGKHKKVSAGRYKYFEGLLTLLSKR